MRTGVFHGPRLLVAGWDLFGAMPSIEVHSICSRSCSSMIDKGRSDLFWSDCASIQNCPWHNILSMGARNRLTVKKTGLKILIMEANDELPINKQLLKLTSPKEFVFGSTTLESQYRPCAKGKSCQNVTQKFLKECKSLSQRGKNWKLAEKRRKKWKKWMPTAPCVPRRSPIQVLTGLNVA